MFCMLYSASLVGIIICWWIKRIWIARKITQPQLERNCKCWCPVLLTLSSLQLQFHFLPPSSYITFVSIPHLFNFFLIILSGCIVSAVSLEDNCFSFFVYLLPICVWRPQSLNCKNRSSNRRSNLWPAIKEKQRFNFYFPHSSIVNELLSELSARQAYILLPSPARVQYTARCNPCTCVCYFTAND